jgi:sulfotransferase family protein
MTRQMVVDQLIERARKETGLDRFDSESYREGLEVLVRDANREDRPDDMVDRFEQAIVKSLSDRLKTTDYLAKRPELLDRPVPRPVFVFGIPRTGTTLLNNLLAADPNRRSALSWEINNPVPPPTSEHLYDDPRALAQLDAERKMLEANPSMGKYYRFSAIYPNECMFMMIHDFKGLAWESRGKLPEYRDWLFSTDMTSTYEYHKQFLQLLQADAPGVWNLKMPSHALWLETLLKIYPDARLVWAHRDPITATSSFCSLIKLGHQTGLGRIDIDWISQDMPWQAIEHADRIMDFRDKFGEDRIVDVHYADMIRTPIEAMRKLYAALGDEYTPEAEAGMRKWIDDNPQNKFGKHEYKLAEFGLTPQKVEKMFERYLARYEVEKEG